MKSLKQLCTPRDNIFDPSKRDIVLDVSDLVQDRINPDEFFEENFITDGMTTLLREAFRRFEKKSAQGVFRLTQAMGGGKTHNLLVLGLLGKHPEYREKVMGHIYKPEKLGAVRVVAFSGRESDAPYGIWGAIAEQLGKKETFNNYYSPLSAPGPTAWINLLRGEPLLILLDELPPYFQAAKAIAIGNSDLSEVTTTALSNLLVAVGKDELSNVCVVLSDLRATYEEGSHLILKALQNFEQEIGRSALNLEPVGMNTDELYHILRKRIFKALPAKEDIKDVAQAYGKAIKDAKQMDITNASPEQFVQQITDAYPFHPAIRDLYARFRENPGFQQTRGLIRLMRVITARLYSEPNGAADRVGLISPFDLDLNDRETLAEITLINPTLGNAISHDIASKGQAVAEVMDANLGGSDAQDSSKLILIGSLANIPNAVLGLTLSEIVSYLCAPGRDISKIKEILGTLSTKAWYLHANREGKLFFRDVQNLVAKLKTIAGSYNRESQLKELRTRLSEMFSPALKDCYQDVVVFPAVDEITIKPERVTLIICEPVMEGLIHKDLQEFYRNLEYKNRVLFLTGQRHTLETLLEAAAELRAITAIIAEMDSEKVPGNDPQRVAANELSDKITQRLLSAGRETFTTLVYPHMDGLRSADFLMNFKDNAYRGEQQIRETLKGKQKFTEEITDDTFRRKCEERLFTQKVMLWTELKKRAATNIKWQWHKPEALDNLKVTLVFQGKWREDGGYVEKPPFPKPQTEVRIKEIFRDDDTGRVVLRLTPVNDDTIYYEIGSAATEGSLKVPEPNKFETDEPTISFLCVDSRREHATGEPVSWKNRITLKHRLYQNGSDRMMEINAAPEAPIKYTTDGSDPKTLGGLYDGPFLVPAGTIVVLAYAEKNCISSETYRFEIPREEGPKLEIDRDKPALWRRSHHPVTTGDAYEFLEKVKKYNVAVSVPRMGVQGTNWVDLTVDEKIYLNAEAILKTLDQLRSLLPDGQVEILATALKFPTGQNLLDWVAEAKTEIKPNEVEQ